MSKKKSQTTMLNDLARHCFPACPNPANVRASRYYEQAGHLVCEKGKLRLVTTDGTRLALAEVDAPGVPALDEYIPHAALEALARGGSDPRIKDKTLTVGGKPFTLPNHDDVSFAPYLKYIEKWDKRKQFMSFNIEGEKLYWVMKRTYAALLDSTRLDQRGAAFKLDPQQGTIKVHAKTYDAEYEEDFDKIPFHGPLKAPLEVGIDMHLLKPFIDRNAWVMVKLFDPEDVVTFALPGGGRWVWYQMPYRLG